MEGKIVNQFPLAFRCTSLKRPEPVVNPLLSQAFAALRCKDIRSIDITASPKILIQWLTRFVDEIDIAPLAAFITNLQPSDLRTNMGMSHLQPGNITDPASCPIAQCEERGPASVSLLLNQRTQDITLILRELARCKSVLWWNIHSPGWVPLQQSLFLHQPPSEAADGRFYPRAMIDSIPLVF